MTYMGFGNGNGLRNHEHIGSSGGDDKKELKVKVNKVDTMYLFVPFICNNVIRLSVGVCVCVCVCV